MPILHDFRRIQCIALFWGEAYLCLPYVCFKNQLEKLEAAKAARLVCLSLLSLTGPYWTVLGLTGPDWASLSLTIKVLLGLTGPYWAY